jgi:uncharacterized protein YjbJ (UPF0337 family)
MQVLRILINYQDQEGWCNVGGKSEKRKGQVEEVAGILTGKKSLESKGKADRRAGEAKEKVGHVKDKVVKVAEKAEGKAGKIIDKAKDASRRK